MAPRSSRLASVPATGAPSRTPATSAARVGRQRGGAALLATVMASSFLLAGFTHFISRGPDFVGGVAQSAGNTLFQSTAVLRAVLELATCIFSVRLLANRSATIPSPPRA